MIRSIVMSLALCSIISPFLTAANRGYNLPGSDPANVFRRALHIWESGDLSQLNEVVADDYVGHVASGNRNREGLRARIQVFHKLYPDMHFDIEDQFTHDEKLVTRMRATGTSTNTGLKTELIGINISRIVKGRISEEWATWEPVAVK